MVARESHYAQCPDRRYNRRIVTRALAGFRRSPYCRDFDDLNLPNLITMARILSVPIIVWAITSGHMLPAFLLFLAAGISDAVDGFLAKRFNMSSELGALLDPVADKALIVSIYVSLGITEALPRWVVILVVSRDILIVGGFLLAMLMARPMAVTPAPGLQAQYRRPDRAGGPGPGVARLQVRRRLEPAR